MNTTQLFFALHTLYSEKNAEFYTSILNKVNNLVKQCPDTSVVFLEMARPLIGSKLTTILN